MHKALRSAILGANPEGPGPVQRAAPRGVGQCSVRSAWRAHARCLMTPASELQCCTWGPTSDAASSCDSTWHRSSPKATRQRTGGDSCRRARHPTQRLPQQAEADPGGAKTSQGTDTPPDVSPVHGAAPAAAAFWGHSHALTMRSRGGHLVHRWRPAKLVGRHDEQASAARGGRPYDVPTAGHRGSAPDRHRRAVG